jgi:prophage regulatory protein
MTTISRLQACLKAAGTGRTKFYDDMSAGLMVPAVKLGERAVGWPTHEVEAVVKARIAGCADEQIRRLVKRLVADRSKLLADLPLGA